MKDFSKVIADKSINYGKFLDHLSIATFSTSAQTELTFNQNENVNKSELFKKIDAIQYAGQETNLPAGLDRALEMFQNPANGARTGKIHMIVLITDGPVSPTWTNDLPASIAKLQSTSIKRFGY